MRRQVSSNVGFKGQSRLVGQCLELLLQLSKKRFQQVMKFECERLRPGKDRFDDTLNDGVQTCISIT